MGFPRCLRTYAYDQRHQLETVTNSLDAAKTVTYGYDAIGNRTSREQNGDLTTFAIDVRNQIGRIEENGLPVGTYRYDYQGLRISKQTDKEIRYLYDGQSVLQRNDPEVGRVIYEYGPDRLLSVDHPTEGRSFYHFDGLGSVTELSTVQSTVLAQYSYDAWGNYRRQIDNEANPFGFTGHEMDDESGLVYMKARFYDPEVGLFLSNDPVEGDPSNPPSLHRYLYAFQNPTVYVDPDGRRGRVVTPAEFMEEQANLASLNEQLAEAKSKAKEAQENIGDFDDEELRAIYSKPEKIQALIRRSKQRIEEAHEFFKEVMVVLEGIDDLSTRRDTLNRYLNDEKLLEYHEAVRLTTQILGTIECDELCQRMFQGRRVIRGIEAMEFGVGLALETIGGAIIEDAFHTYRLSKEGWTAIREADDAVAFARAQRALEEFIPAHLSRSQRQKKAGGVAVGVADVSTGRTAVGVSKGGVPDDLHPELKKVLDDFGGESFCSTVPAACAEIDAANQLLHLGAKLEDLRFSTPVMARTLEPQRVCFNCQSFLSQEAFDPKTGFEGDVN